MKEFFSLYKLPIIFGGLGLLLAVLWLTVGFFKTLLILIMTAIGVGIGFYLKETKLLDEYFKS
ncbi:MULTISPECIES: DUF2273 domain-containing protein [Enterococcus]|jgi:uncharacterized membrane protein|uniref:DUF2273 domain-containing protein n=1 Tax=Enterococcus mundtii TaxID=53346 RepID=A0A1V2UKW8_ENTMU|nr:MULTISPECIES: DUF2273 domain-containing protein [Enterococcus]MBE6173535.1 DUF2273 domain-containing protein [Enterococcus faecium]EOH61762.1 small integral membrane protein [Enterococcus mundtii ATCC 882]EOU12728.1 small integral membrane protein [Enterococcus mundtii ATCC 882]MBE9911897.1 DUF2273 domain-containing protein [Enterococcus mundtii]MBO1087267.1 DUF2273 domain-containing protein [Enterococcus mundtii]